MTAALALAPKAPTRLFLGVERSVCGRAWRDRLDDRATARALAIAQRHHVPELLARILAGRGVEADEVEAYLDPTVRRLMPDPHTVTAMEQAAQRIADAMVRGEQVAIFGDYDVDGATASALLARFLRNGGSAFALKLLLGHTSLYQTNKYVALVEADMKQQHRDCSPGNRV